MIRALSFEGMSTEDWVTMNMDGVDSRLIVAACAAYDEEAFEMIEWLNPPDANNDPDEPPELYGGVVPAHTRVWTCERDSEQYVRDALDASGFEMFEVSGEHPVEFFFGVDGGGYSFFGQHWIPLRARLAAHFALSGEHFDPDPAAFRKFLAMLEGEMKAQGEDLEARVPEVYARLAEVEAAEAAE